MDSAERYDPLVAAVCWEVEVPALSLLYIVLLPPVVPSLLPMPLRFLNLARACLLSDDVHPWPVLLVKAYIAMAEHFPQVCAKSAWGVPRCADPLTLDFQLDQLIAHMHHAGAGIRWRSIRSCERRFWPFRGKPPWCSIIAMQS